MTRHQAPLYAENSLNMPEDLDKSVVEPAKERFADFKNGLHRLPKSAIPLLLILIAVPVTLALALTNQTFFNHAGGSSFESIEVNPGVLNVQVGQKVPMSALAYDAFHNPVNSGVYFQWSMSSNNSVGTLSKTDGDISEFKALKAGCGEITVTGNGSITKTVGVAVSGNGIIPDCQFNSGVYPYSWIGDHTSLEADDFYILANGKKFTAKDADVKIHTSAPYPPDLEKTTFEATWKENGVDMRLYFYVTRDNDVWRVTEVRTYDGKAINPDWLFYPGFGPGQVGSSFVQPSFDLTSETDVNHQFPGKIHFSNFRFNAFLTQIPQSGYYIYRSDSNINPPSDNTTSSSYVAFNFLYKDGGIVHDQSNLAYSWSNDDQSVASIQPFVEDYDCQNNQISPCPLSRIGVVGKTPGYSAARLKIIDKTTSQTLASTCIAISVEQDPANNTHCSQEPTDTPTPTEAQPTDTPTPTLTPTPTITPTPKTKTINITASSDSYVSALHPNTRYGTAIQLWMDGSPISTTYMKFDLTPIAGHKIIKATLKFRVSSQGGSDSLGTFRIWPASSSWSESTLNYNNKPALGIPLIASFTAPQLGQILTFDVTNKISGTSAGFGITTGSANEAAIASKESSNGTKPLLIIQYQ